MQNQTLNTQPKAVPQKRKFLMYRNTANVNEARKAWRRQVFRVSSMLGIVPPLL